MRRRREILRYLGYSGIKPNPGIEAAIDKVEKEVEAVMCPRTVRLEIPTEDIPWPCNTVSRAVRDSKRAVIFAATLGAGVDRLIMQKECSNISEAVIAGAVAAALIEEVCDALQGEYDAYPRVSPGYGDFPLSANRELLKMLNTGKIGLSITEALMLVPTKSVTALFGIKEK